MCPTCQTELIGEVFRAFDGAGCCSRDCLLRYEEAIVAAREEFYGVDE